MPSTSSGRPGRRAVRHDRHGRRGRSLVTGPFLPPLGGRVDHFEQVVAGAAEFLKREWPDELRSVRYEIGPMPMPGIDVDGAARWWVSEQERRIVLYRLPIQRFARLHRNDDHHRRMNIEGAVFEATAEYLGRDPWDLGIDDFGH